MPNGSKYITHATNTDPEICRNRLHFIPAGSVAIVMQFLLSH